VLQNAIADYTNPKSTEYRKLCAARWLASTSLELMSSRWICMALFEDGEQVHDRLYPAVKQLTGKPNIPINRVDIK
jgi:hypothetical protein